MDSDLANSGIFLLSDAFKALADQYKGLAAKHQLVENRLQAASQELQHFRALHPASAAHYKSKALHVDIDPDVVPNRSLTEWLYTINGVNSESAPEHFSVIERAGFVCFTLESKTSGACPYNNMAQTPAPQAINKPMLQLDTAPQIPDMEEDFTQLGSRQGKLNCPFAVTPSPSGLRRLTMPPTPRSSRSRNSSAKPKSKRSSFHDPLRPETVISEEGSIVRDGSIAGSGPACPIRFLGDHSPEEIAKYFDEHKQDMPRSHELCIKRFQSNAESIRELDQKYGNLVMMIQGLGKMHKPMMPATPIAEVDEDAVDGFDEVRSNAKSNFKVRKWAQAISNDGGPAQVAQKQPEPQSAASESAAEERQSHWDRPLREVRVGESPSRPWGVPIPSKYLDRRESHDSTPAPPPNEAAASVNMEKQEAVGVTKERPKGKCPFDHKAMLAAGMPMPPGMTMPTKHLDTPSKDVDAHAPTTETTPMPTPEPKTIPNSAPEPPTRPQMPARQPAHKDLPAERDDTGTKSPDSGHANGVVNQGTMFFQDASSWQETGRLINASGGKVFVGYDIDSVLRIMREIELFKGLRLDA